MFSQRPTKNPLSRHIKIDKSLEKIEEEFEIPNYMEKKLKKLKYLGRGAFGKVYLAYHKDLGLIALKEIKLNK